MSDSITRDERRELRTIVKLKYKVLRGQISRRTDEMKSEIHQELLARHRAEDAAIAAAKEEVNRINNEGAEKIKLVSARLKAEFPDLDVSTYSSSIHAQNRHKERISKEMFARVPAMAQQILVTLNNEEAEVLTDLAKGALGSQEALEFLDKIPSLEQIAPRVNLQELEEEIKKHPKTEE